MKMAHKCLSNNTPVSSSSPAEVEEEEVNNEEIVVEEEEVEVEGDKDDDEEEKSEDFEEEEEKAAEEVFEKPHNTSEVEEVVEEEEKSAEEVVEKPHNTSEVEEVVEEVVVEGDKNDEEEETPIVEKSQTTTVTRSLAKRPNREEAEIVVSDKKSEKRRKKKRKNIEIVVEEEEGSKDVEDGDQQEEEKKKLTPKFGSNHDEKVILKALLKLVKNNKPLPPSAVDMKGFLDTIKSSLQRENVTVRNISDKIRRLRDRYEKEKNGVRVDFRDTHSARIYQLSKKIWGGHPVETSAEGEKTDSGVFRWMDEWMHSKTSKGLIKPPLSLGEGFFDLGSVGNVKKEELEKKRKNLLVSEMKVYLEKLELMTEHTKAVLDAKLAC